MNLASVGHLLGRLCLVLSGLLLLPLLVGWHDGTLGDPASVAFVATAGGTFLAGLLLGATCRFDPQRFELPEAFAGVTAAWLVFSAVASIPFVASGGIASPVDAFFEAMSGTTTTGASILSDPAALGRTLLLWRALLHLVGGLGIVALYVAVLPALGAGGTALFQAEASGPEKNKLLPRIADVSKLLWLVYLGLTALVVLAYLIGGMEPFDAVCHGFATVSTGGFSTRADSLASFSPAIQWTAVAFMLVSSMNFLLLVAVVRGRPGAMLGSAEWRASMAWVAAAVVLALGVRAATEGVPAAVEPWLRGTVFSIVSVASTTGFGTEDFDGWAPPLHMLLMALMLVGGSSGSTAGGAKVSRLVLWVKGAAWRERILLRPQAVFVPKLESRTIERAVIFKALGFLAVALASWALIAGALVGLGMGPESAFSATVSCLGGVGPGLDAVGPTLNYAPLPDAAKLLLCLAMLLGRLEYFSVLVLFAPRTWRR